MQYKNANQIKIFFFFSYFLTAKMSRNMIFRRSADNLNITCRRWFISANLMTVIRGFLTHQTMFDFHKLSMSQTCFINNNCSCPICSGLSCEVLVNILAVFLGGGVGCFFGYIFTSGRSTFCAWDFSAAFSTMDSNTEASMLRPRHSEASFQKSRLSEWAMHIPAALLGTLVNSLGSTHSSSANHTATAEGISACRRGEDLEFQPSIRVGREDWSDLEWLLGRSESFRNCWSTGIFTHNHL